MLAVTNSHSVQDSMAYDPESKKKETLNKFTIMSWKRTNNCESRSSTKETQKLKTKESSACNERTTKEPNESPNMRRDKVPFDDCNRKSLERMCANTPRKKEQFFRNIHPEDRDSAGFYITHEKETTARNVKSLQRKQSVRENSTIATNANPISVKPSSVTTGRRLNIKSKEDNQKISKVDRLCYAESIEMPNNPVANTVTIPSISHTSSEFNQNVPQSHTSRNYEPNNNFIENSNLNPNVPAFVPGPIEGDITRSEIDLNSLKSLPQSVERNQNIQQTTTLGRKSRSGFLFKRRTTKIPTVEKSTSFSSNIFTTEDEKKISKDVSKILDHLDAMRLNNLGTAEISCNISNGVQETNTIPIIMSSYPTAKSNFFTNSSMANLPTATIQPSVMFKRENIYQSRTTVCEQDTAIPNLPVKSAPWLQEFQNELPTNNQLPIYCTDDSGKTHNQSLTSNNVLQRPSSISQLAQRNDDIVQEQHFPRSIVFPQSAHSIAQPLQKNENYNNLIQGQDFQSGNMMWGKKVAVPNVAIGSTTEQVSQFVPNSNCIQRPDSMKINVTPDTMLLENLLIHERQRNLDSMCQPRSVHVESASTEYAQKSAHGLDSEVRTYVENTRAVIPATNNFINLQNYLPTTKNIPVDYTSGSKSNDGDMNIQMNLTNCFSTESLQRNVVPIEYSQKPPCNFQIEMKNNIGTNHREQFQNQGKFIEPRNNVATVQNTNPADFIPVSQSYDFDMNFCDYSSTCYVSQPPPPINAPNIDNLRRIATYNVHSETQRDLESDHGEYQSGTFAVSNNSINNYIGSQNNDLALPKSTDLRYAEMNFSTDYNMNFQQNSENYYHSEPGVKYHNARENYREKENHFQVHTAYEKHSNKSAQKVYPPFHEAPVPQGILKSPGNLSEEKIGFFSHDVVHQNRPEIYREKRVTFDPDLEK